MPERNLTVFTSEVHILALLPNLTQIHSSNNNLDHICHLVSPSSLPTLFFDRSALRIDVVCQRIVTRSAGSYVAGCTGNLAAGNALHLAAVGCFGPGGIGNSLVLVPVCLAIEHTGCSAGGAEHFVVVGLANHHPSPLLYFLQMGQCGPHPHFSFICFGATMAQGISVSWSCASTFIKGDDVGVGGIGQSFLDLNKFSDVDPVLGHGVPTLAGIFSSGGGLLSAEEPPWGGFSQSFPFAKFIIVIGMVTGICMVTLSALGVSACLGLATTHTLYHLVGINFLLLSFVFVPLLTKGLVLGCMGLG